MRGRRKGGGRIRVAALGWTILAVVSPAPAPAHPAAQARAAAAEIMARAARLERSGRLEEAYRALGELLRVDPLHLPGLAALLRVSAALGEPERALPAVEDAVERARTVTAVRQTWVRALSATGLSDSAVAVARRWTSERPAEIGAWAELAGALRAGGDRAAAVGALVAGRQRAGDRALFAQELAELHVELGDLAAAAEEWVTVLTWGEAGVATVAGRLRALGPRRPAAVGELWARLISERVPPAAARAGLELAYVLEEPERAHALLAAFVARLPDDAAIPLLREQALRAREREWSRMARWAAEQLATRAQEPGERRRWRALSAEAALAEGDTSEARETLEALVGRAPPGSDAHRIALSRLFAIRAAESPRRAGELLETFALHYGGEGGGREVARMAVELSRRHVERGELTAAERALASVPSPSDAAVAAELEGQAGRILLYRGLPRAAAARLEAAAWIPTDDAESRTEAIALLDAVSRADSSEAVVLGSLLYRLEREPPGARDAERSLEAWDRLPASDARPALLALAAGRLEKRGATEGAALVRRALVRSHPDASQVPAALLALARGALPGDSAAARVWLERLIVEHPRSALTPVARRLLAELEGRVPSS